MRRIRPILPAALALALLIPLTGCPRTPAASQPGANPAPPAPPPKPPVEMTAYINVSSGCQQETVDFIKELDKEHGERLQVEFVDFGKSPGIERWAADGLNCMTILIDGEETVTFGPPDDRQFVTFSFPAGLQWEHEDLQKAVAAALDGTLTPGAEPGAKSREMEPVKAKVTATTADGKAQVCVEGTPVFEYSAEFDEQTPEQRAKKSAERLRSAFLQGLAPNDVQVKAVEGAHLVHAFGAQLAVASERDATDAKMDTEELATTWASDLRKSIVAAKLKARPKKAEPTL